MESEEGRRVVMGYGARLFLARIGLGADIGFVYISLGVTSTSHCNTSLQICPHQVLILMVLISLNA